MALDYLSFGDIQLLHYHKVIKIWTPLLHCQHLLDFVKPPAQEHLELYINPPPPLPHLPPSIHCKKSKLCDFIFSSPPVAISAYKMLQKIIPTSDYSLIWSPKCKWYYQSKFWLSKLYKKFIQPPFVSWPLIL